MNVAQKIVYVSLFAVIMIDTVSVFRLLYVVISCCYVSLLSPGPLCYSVSLVDSDCHCCFQCPYADSFQEGCVWNVREWRTGVFTDSNGALSDSKCPSEVFTWQCRRFFSQLDVIRYQRKRRRPTKFIQQLSLSMMRIQQTRECLCLLKPRRDLLRPQEEWLCVFVALKWVWYV